MDAHEGEDGRWFALIDADEHGENYEYFNRERWFYYSKRVCLGLLILFHLWKSWNCFAAMSLLLASFYKKWFSFIGSEYHKSLKSRLSRHSWKKNVFGFIKNWTMKSVVFVVLVTLALFIFFVIFTDIESTCVEPGSMPTQQCFAASSSGINLSLQRFDEEMYKGNYQYDDLVVVTAASSAFMERLRNFVGSVHYWEPYLNLTIYDLGLAEADLIEISQWKRVQVLSFPFDQYPVHVSLLYNFAWKIVMLHEALKIYPRFIYFDSGMEIRRPLTDVQYYMNKDGYYGIQLRGSI